MDADGNGCPPSSSELGWVDQMTGSINLGVSLSPYGDKGRIANEKGPKCSMWAELCPTVHGPSHAMCPLWATVSPMQNGGEC